MPAGRPSDYKAEFAEQAAKLTKLGATDMEMADFFEVSVRTLYAWKNAHPKFLQALKVGKEEADNRVKRSLFQRAVGFEHDSVKIFCQEGQVIEAPYREYIPPDTTAGIFWLKNRLPDEFRDKSELAITDNLSERLKEAQKRIDEQSK
jgi:hypothetical protein